METPLKYVGLREAMDLLKEQGVKVTRQRYKKITIATYLAMIERDDLRIGLGRLYLDHPFLQEAPAGARHHHWWKGGLEDHCMEMLGIGLDLMELYAGDLEAGFTKDDLITAVFLHDFSKVFIYRYISAEEREKAPNKFKAKQVFTYREGATSILDAENLTAQKLMQYGVPVTPKQWSAVVFAEGGFSKAHFGFAGQTTLTGGRVNHENPLAAFLSILDLYSAMILGQELR
jgi:hypothetical protein